MYKVHAKKYIQYMQSTYSAKKIKVTWGRAKTTEGL